MVTYNVLSSYSRSAEESEEAGETQWPATSHWHTESHTGKEISSTRHLEWLMVMVHNATFTNMSVILLLSVLTVEESAVHVPGENHQPAASHWARLELATLMVIDTGCIGSCKSNLLTIMTTMVPTSSGDQTNNIRGDRHFLHR